jgi:hypothetical protein
MPPAHAKNYVEAPLGLFIVRYDTPEAMSPDLQGPLQEAMRRRLSQRIKVGVIFLVGPAVTSVRVEVPAFWLGVTRELRLSAMAIVTRAATVRVAALGFRIANKARGVPLPVETFEDEAPAVAWAKGFLGSSPL